MRIRLGYLLMFLILFTFELKANVNNPTAIKGILDLREISNPAHFTVELNGEWEFYWHVKEKCSGCDLLFSVYCLISWRVA